MNARFSPAVEELIRLQMAAGNYDSENDLLTDALAALAAEDREVKAIQESLDLVDAGEPGLPAAQVFENLRIRHGLRP